PLMGSSDRRSTGYGNPWTTMHKYLSTILFAAMLTCGCQSARHSPVVLRESLPTEARKLDVALVEYQSAEPREAFTPSSPEPLTLETAVARAEAANPAIAEAEARMRALRGEWLQAGLGPKPSLGYVGSEMGNDGSAGQQGVYAGQEIVTGGKLARQRRVVAAEIDMAEQQLVATRMRVTTD